VNEMIAVCSRSFSKDDYLRNELLRNHPNAKFNDRGISLEGSELTDFLRGCSAAIVGLEAISREVLLALPELKIISKFGVGLDSIDLDAMRDLQRRLGWTPGINKRSVSELVVALTLNLLRNVTIQNNEVVSGKWRQITGKTLSGKTVGIIGCNNIGKDLIQLLENWECKILACDIAPDRELELGGYVHYVTLETLLETSDVVSLHLPLNSSTRNILSAEKLGLLQKSSVLINTSRGGLVDEAALKDLLVRGELAGAAFDVFEFEPAQDSELLRLPNFLATPHIGGSTSESIRAMGEAAIAGLTTNSVPA
jgi:phosphoglycerate dehydrogenase-like enzyme